MLVSTAPAEERVDLDMVTKIREEGFRHSKVMETASELMDRIGPRLTGSPQVKEANEWTKSKLAEWGLANAHLESWGPFGRGWRYEACAVRMTAPDKAELLALPQAWTPGTNGAVHASVVHVNPKTKEDLDKYKGTVAGKIVLWGDVREVKPHDTPDLTRYDEKSLAEVVQYDQPAGRAPRYNREEYIKRFELRKAADAFFEEEKPLAIIDLGRGDFGTFGVQGGGEWRMSKPKTAIPSLEMESEHFGRIARLLDRKVDVQLELDVRVQFIDEDQMQWNTIAEIPGTDKKDEVVMVGAHLDSWQGGTGATDNGAGSVVAMEVMRILKALDAHPRRTIRIGLWTGEEQGLFGSRAYVDQHFASRPKPTKEEEDVPWYRRKEKWPLTVKPEHAKLAAYFNLDNGTGKIRGIYAEENSAVVPIFEAWLKPLHDLGATAVTMNTTGGTDHESFDQVGLPGFQFIQDEIEYETRTHHTNMDLYERLVKADLQQAAVVMACFTWDAATRDAMLPRKPLPKEPPKDEKPTAVSGAPAKPTPAPAKTP
ncbi:MAG TPA: M20/M25/M40 family metallo-hydrolase [Thermoanaerobaculia bacterium]|nr:M20/M25/M40 family metallo-hydrolase [Thermoanaerobaculia bacterium]